MIGWILLLSILVGLLYIVIVIATAVIEVGVPLAPSMHYRDRLPCAHESDDSGTLQDYTLLGTHGSAAYKVNPYVVVDDRGVSSKRTFSWLRGLVMRWSLNQHYDIYSQLCMGVRFLQLEVSLYQGEWVTLHSYLCGSLVADLAQIVKFIEKKDNPAFVLLKVELFGVGSEAIDRNGKTIGLKLEELCGHHLWPKESPIQKNTPLVSLRKKIIVVQDCLMYPEDYTTDIALFKANRSGFTARPPSTSLECFQWVMTPSTADLVWSLLRPFPVTGLHRLPAVAAGRTHRW